MNFLFLESHNIRLCSRSVSSSQPCHGSAMTASNHLRFQSRTTYALCATLSLWTRQPRSVCMYSLLPSPPPQRGVLGRNGLFIASLRLWATVLFLHTALISVTLPPITSELRRNTCGSWALLGGYLRQRPP